MLSTGAVVSTTVIVCVAKVALSQLSVAVNVRTRVYSAGQSPAVIDSLTVTTAPEQLS